MVYEARNITRFNYVLAVLCALLSILGFAVAGVIPTKSGSAPLAGWIIVALCFGVAAIFVRRARDQSPQLRVDARGLWVRAHSDQTIPWDQILAGRRIRMRNQSILNLELRNPELYPSRYAFTRLTRPLDRALGFGSMGVNPTYLSGGMNGLVTAMLHYKPDLLEAQVRL